MSDTEEAMRHWALAAIGTLALAGCDRAPSAPEPTPAPVPPATPAEPVSIIRDEIESAREAPPPLAPLAARVGFPSGGAELAKKAQAELATVLESPQVAAGGAITLRGHSDAAGSDTANLAVSRARAEAVRDWLVEHGVDQERISVIAFGEQNPIQPNALADGSPNEPGRAANRRVDLSVAVPAGTPAARPTERPETLVDELTRPAEE